MRRHAARSRRLALARLAPLALVLPVVLPVAVGAQTPADGQLCERAQAPARFPEARPRLQAMVAAGGATAAFAQGCLHLADDRLGPAEEAFARAVAAAPENAVAEFYLGRVYGEQAQRASVFRQASLARKTKASFERAVRLDPDYLEARQGLLQYFLVAPGVMGGSEERAREQAAEIRRRNPYRGALAATQVLQKRKDWAGVEREMEPLTRQYPESLAVWTTLGGALGAQGRWDDAWASADRMTAALRDAPVTWYLAGRVAAESGTRLERGEAALLRYLQHRPEPTEPTLAAAHWRMGQLRERQGQREAARTAYQTAVRLDPKLKSAQESLARLR
jgi:tetratricopeptide (TPR) repeat protein